MNFTGIIVAYWHAPIPELPYKHREEFEYSREKMDEIMERVMGAGYSLMFRKTLDNELLIWIDKGRFGQK